MQKIIPNIWFNKTAPEAGAFYEAIFPGSKASIDSFYPTQGLMDFQEDLAGEALTVTFQLGEYRFVFINAGPEFRPNPRISFILNFDPLLFGNDKTAARHELDRVWKALGEGGEIRMDLGEYPFSPHYGWVEDKYGVNWQLISSDPDGAPRPFVIPAMLFSGTSDFKAESAVDFYLDVFEDSELGDRFYYPEQDGETGGIPESEHSRRPVMYSDFRIGNQWFAATDSKDDMPFSFDCGVSFQVDCRDQTEIDFLWETLSAVPEAEQCGWLADQFGVAWQIVPENMEELMRRPNAWNNMMAMHKIVIDDF